MWSSRSNFPLELLLTPDSCLKINQSYAFIFDNKSFQIDNKEKLLFIWFLWFLKMQVIMKSNYSATTTIISILQAPHPTNYQIIWLSKEKDWFLPLFKSQFLVSNHCICWVHAPNHRAMTAVCLLLYRLMYPSTPITPNNTRQQKLG